MTQRSLDPQIAAGIREAMAATASRPAPADGQLRSALDAAMASYRVAPEHPVDWQDRTIGEKLVVRIYRPQAEEYSALVIFCHGGGRIAGNLETHHGSCATLADDAGAVVVSVDYRLAPEYPVPAQEEDVLAAVIWAEAHREELGATGLPLVIAGDSAGGGIAAGVALALRDGDGPELALQMLLYPSLHDRVEPPSDRQLVRLMTWTPTVNALSWRHALGDDPQRSLGLAGNAEDLTGLPRTYLEVGDTDLFLVSVLEFATGLARAGVPLELHVHPGLPHAGEAMAPAAELSRRIRADRAAVLRALAG